MNLTLKEKTVQLLNAIETGAQEPVSYINGDCYKQHNLGAADGLAGFGALLGQLANYPEPAKVKVVRVLQDGDYVFTHTDYNFFGPKVGFDIWKFQDGRIVEHWDNLQETVTETVSGHSMTDGPTEVKDLEKTAANKELVKGFVNDVLMGKNPQNTANYFDGNNYIQHNPGIADGLSGLGAAMAAMAEQGIQMVYDVNHIILGEGNFVLSVSEGSFAGQHTAFYDLFRIENGKIAEHWDVVETIIPADKALNGNGKFNF